MYLIFFQEIKQGEQKLVEDEDLGGNNRKLGTQTCKESFQICDDWKCRNDYLCGTEGCKKRLRSELLDRIEYFSSLDTSNDSNSTDVHPILNSLSLEKVIYSCFIFFHFEIIERTSRAKRLYEIVVGQFVNIRIVQCSTMIPIIVVTSNPILKRKVL